MSAAKLKASLFAFITVEYQSHTGRDYSVDCEVDYTFDGNDLNITNVAPLGGNDWDINTDWFDELVLDAINDRADDDYAEWLADQGEIVAPDMGLAA